MSVDGRGLQRHVVEVGSAANVSGVFFPGVGFTFGNGQAAPAVVAVIDLAVAAGEHVGRNRFANGLLNFALRRPQVCQINLLAVFSLADGIFAEIEVDASGQGEGDHQRRRHQVVGAHFGIDAAFEIPIAGEHRSDDQVFLVDRFGDLFRQRPGVADAGGAAVSDDVELDFLEIRQQARLSPDNRGRLSSRERAKSSPRVEPVSPFSTAFFATSPAATITDGFEVLVQLVIAAITTLPWRRDCFTLAETCSSCNVVLRRRPRWGLPPSCSQRSTCLDAARRSAAELRRGAGFAADFGFISDGSAVGNDSPACERTTRS